MPRVAVVCVDLATVYTLLPPRNTEPTIPAEPVAERVPVVNAVAT